ncbi:hypothetical protein CspeluHIS016_0201940 [Cutaneotrichosporon spelunceum]|uniref:Uncharacterized protein n=1 Tax=Cutaneotrichosporon spelunceum TaxID=1672016 RepID=A0AAD3TQK2_9TREE|nr:hypothetical protein CspeluHIS016_0201940 [Cutaneotrichosporon spelunceum]
MKLAIALTSLLSFAVANPVDVVERANIEARKAFEGTAIPGPGSNLNCRTWPSTSARIVTKLQHGQKIVSTCQRAGEKVRGNEVWNNIYVPGRGRCYVSDHYTQTGYKWIPSSIRCEQLGI